jgi:hypothetical protein
MSHDPEIATRLSDSGEGLGFTTIRGERRQGLLDDLGLVPALLWHIERYTARTGVHIRLLHDGLVHASLPLDCAPKRHTIPDILARARAAYERARGRRPRQTGREGQTT